MALHWNGEEYTSVVVNGETFDNVYVNGVKVIGDEEPPPADDPIYDFNYGGYPRLMDDPGYDMVFKWLGSYSGSGQSITLSEAPEANSTFRLIRTAPGVKFDVVANIDPAGYTIDAYGQTITSPGEYTFTDAVTGGVNNALMFAQVEEDTGDSWTFEAVSIKLSKNQDYEWDESTVLNEYLVEDSGWCEWDGDVMTVSPTNDGAYAIPLGLMFDAGTGGQIVCIAECLSVDGAYGIGTLGVPMAYEVGQKSWFIFDDGIAPMKFIGPSGSSISWRLKFHPVTSGPALGQPVG